MGISSRRPQWAQESEIMLHTKDWKDIAWSDESWFLLWHSDGRIRTWNKQDGSMDPSCLISSLLVYYCCTCLSLYGHCMSVFWWLLPVVRKLKSAVFLNTSLSSMYCCCPIKHLFDVWNRKFTSMTCSWKICSNFVMLSNQYRPKSLRSVSSTLLNLCHKGLGQIWRQKRV